VPIAVSAGLTSFIFIFATGQLPSSFPPLVAFQSLDRFPLLAVPFFILAGQLMSTGGIARTILKFVDTLFGGIHGGYALVTILACAMFADLSGSAPATVAAIGTLMIPGMITQGYHPAFAAAVAASAGVLALVIPPSNTMVLYGLSGSVSIGRMFLAGFLPGAILTASLMIPAYFICRYYGWQSEKKRGSAKEIIAAAWDAKWAFLVPVIILGGIYSGMFTPTESAAVACVYALFVGLFIYREFTVRDLPRIMNASASIIVAVMFIVAMATVFGQIITLMGVPQSISDRMLAVSDNPLVALLLINVLLLVVGMFMDGGAAIILLTPVLLAAALKLQLDPVYFGVIMIINLAIGTLTPPLGVNLFVANSIAKVSSEKIFLAAIPLILSMLVGLAVIIRFPEISLVIPRLYYGN
jgi:C4-dicarboxylate transporter DctM subunit